MYLHTCPHSQSVDVDFAQSVCDILLTKREIGTLNASVVDPVLYGVKAYYSFSYSLVYSILCIVAFETKKNSLQSSIESNFATLLRVYHIIVNDSGLQCVPSTSFTIQCFLVCRLQYLVHDIVPDGRV